MDHPSPSYLYTTPLPPRHLVPRSQLLSGLPLPWKVEGDTLSLWSTPENLTSWCQAIDDDHPLLSLTLTRVAHCPNCEKPLS